MCRIGGTITCFSARRSSKRARSRRSGSRFFAPSTAARWAPGFLHLRDLDEDGATYRGLVAATDELGRPLAIVHREARAFLQSSLSPAAYYEQAVRKKKRKEQGRLINRLSEVGTITHRRIEAGAAQDQVALWLDDFLAMERAGWKGAEGSALACRPETAAFFRGAVQGAAAAGRLQMLRIDLDARPIAMLINFLTPPGSYSFKTAFAEDYGAFLAWRDDSDRQSPNPRTARHRLDGQLRGRGSSDDRQHLARAAHDRARDAAACRGPPPRRPPFRPHPRAGVRRPPPLGRHQAPPGEQE